MSTYKSKIIKIDSSKASTYYNAFQTNFSFTVDPAISVDNDELIVFSLLNVWIPYSFYSVSKYNQYLDVTETIGTVTSSRTVILPAGNYSAYDWAKTVMTCLNTTQGIQYSIVYNRNNNRYSISTIANTSSILLFHSGPNALNSCCKLLGFSNVDTVINNMGVLSGCITMNDIYYFQIKTNIGDSNTFITGDENDSLLEIIPVSAEPLSFISYTPFQPNKFLLRNSSLHDIRIHLVDNYGRDVNLQNIPFLLTIKIDMISHADAGLAKPVGRADAPEEDYNKSRLQLLTEQQMQQEDIITTIESQRDPAMNLKDFLEYQLLDKMLRKVNKKKSKK